jgi:hypothetical protein
MTKVRYSLRVLLLALLMPLAGRAEFPSSQPFPGITYGHAERRDPPEMLYWVVVDLTNPAISLRVSPAGADPDGPGPYQTTLMRPSDIAARDGLDVVVNGDFFAAKGVQDAEGSKSRYAPGQWAYVIGPAATDGKIWAKARQPRPCLAISADGKASIVMSSKAPANPRYLIGGNVMLVEDGKKVAHPNEKAIHPRTAVGLDEKGTKLVLLVVDGRRILTSVGMSYEQLADEMIRLGCHTAMNLDGGGSSAMVIRDAAANEWKVMNIPSDGRERAVADVLGVRIATNGRSGEARKR